MGFNDGLLKARESPAVPLNTLRAIDYDSDVKEVQYGPDEHALPKVHPSTPQGVLAYLATEFGQGTSQVSDGPAVFEAVNAHSNPPLEGDIVVDPIVVTAIVPKNTSKVEPDLTSELTSSEEI